MYLSKRNLGEVVRGSAWALVTGAALGIGRQYAEQLAALGYNLLVVFFIKSAKVLWSFAENSAKVVGSFAENRFPI